MIRVVLLLAVTFILSGCGMTSFNMFDSANVSPGDSTIKASQQPQSTEQATQPITLSAAQDSDNDGVGDSIDECPGTSTSHCVDSFGCPVPLYVKVTLNFGSNQSALDLTYRARLLKIADILQNNPNAEILIEGHTDDIGDAAVNMALSEHRAASVKQALLAFTPNAGSRVRTQGHGESVPLVSNKTESGRSRNRRVEISIRGFYRSPTSYIALNRPYTMQFAASQSGVSSRGKVILDDLGQYLKANPGVVAKLDGFTDTSGDSRENLLLSQQRADAIKKYLSEQFQISQERLRSRGFGEANPIASNQSRLGREKNRRVSITLSRLDAAPKYTPIKPAGKQRFRAKLSVGAANSSQNALLNKGMSFTYPRRTTEISPEAKNKIDQIGALLSSTPDLKVVIEGHTDSSGVNFQDMAISKQRAERVRQYLSQSYSVSENRMRVIGFGADLPVAGNDTEKGRRQNRRVSIRIDKF